jgi:hypothetical protein
MESSVYTPLAAPVSGGAAEREDDYVEVSWGSVTGASSYNVYYGTSSGGSLTLLRNLSQTVTNDDIDGGLPEKVSGLWSPSYSSVTVSLSWTGVSGNLASSATRYYRIAGVNMYGEGPKSSEVYSWVSPVISGYKVYRNEAFLVGISSSVTSCQDSGLLPSTEYRYRVSALTSDGLEGALSEMVVVVTSDSYNSGASTTVLHGISLAVLDTIREVNDDYVELKWFTAAGAVKYNIYCSTNSNGSLTLLGSSAEPIYNDDLDGGQPGKVNGISAVTESSTTVSISWTAVSAPVNSGHRYYRICGVNSQDEEGYKGGELEGWVSPVIAGYKVYRDGEYAGYVSSGTRYVDVGLQEKTTYVYYVSAVTSDGFEGVVSQSTSCVTFRGGIAGPEDVSGVKIISEDGVLVRIGFTKITKKNDGTDIGGDLKGYIVYRSVDGVSGWVKILELGAGATEFNDRYNGVRYYYRIKAKDVYNQESDGLMMVNTDDWVVVNSKDLKARVVFDDEDTKEYLYGEYNGIGQDIKVEVEREEGSGGNVLCEYTIRLKGSNGQELEGLSMPETSRGAQVVIYYGDTSGATRKESIRNGLSSDEEVVLYWYNGVKWLKIKGEVDTGQKSITIRTRLFGRYRVEVVKKAGRFMISNVEPKIFSPNESNSVISRVRFYIENPNGVEVKGTIYDREGREVRSNIEAEQANVLYWDGRGSDGTIVKSGVYIYQIEADGKTENGTVVVAK